MDPFSRAIERAARVRQDVSVERVNDVPPSLLAVGTQDSLMADLTPATVVNKQVESLLRNGANQRDYQDSGYAFDILKVRLQQRLELSRANAFFVTSPTDGNGKTNTAVNLAFSLAQSADRQVVLVDMDLRKPGVHRYLNVAMPGGVADLVAGKAKLEDVAFSPGLKSLTIIPGRDAVAHATDLIGSPEMTRFVRLLCRPDAGRLVIFDMPPVLGCADTIAFSALVNHYILVAEAGKTRTTELDEVTRLLQGAHMLGSVLNKGKGGHHAYG